MSLEDKLQHMKDVHASAVQKLEEELRVAMETANAERILAQKNNEEIQRLQSQSKKQLDLEVAVKIVRFVKRKQLSNQNQWLIT